MSSASGRTTSAAREQVAVLDEESGIARTGQFGRGAEGANGAKGRADDGFALHRSASIATQGAPFPRRAESSGKRLRAALRAITAARG